MSLAAYINNYYLIRNKNMNVETYNKLLRLYKSINDCTEKYVNSEEWNGLYVRNMNSLPETPPSRYQMITIIRNKLQTNYLDLILNFYKLLDSITDIKNISNTVKEELQFISFILSKQSNTVFKIDVATWNTLRQRCLLNKHKTQMPRDTITLSEIIKKVHSILSIN
jgi:hypothetical protein